MSTYDSSKPEDTGFLSEAPTELRNNFKGLKEDQIVDAALLKGLAPGNVNGQIPINNGVENENLNAGKLNNKTASDFAAKVHVHDMVTASSDGFMTAMQNNKLASIAAGAEVNQMAYSNVLVGETTIQADSKTDTLEMVAGTNIAIIADATNDRLTIGVTGKVSSSALADNATTAGVCTGNSATATQLETARTITTSGDVLSTPTSFNGTSNITLPLVLSNSGISAGSYKNVTVDVKGRVISGSNPTTLSGFGITDAWTKTESNNQFAPFGVGGIGSLAVDISNQSIGVLLGKSGFYKGYNVASAPNAGWWYFIVVAHDSNYTTIEAINYSAAYERYSSQWIGGGWTGWTRILTTQSNLLGVPGYHRFSSGLVLQWGLVSHGTASVAVVFPIAMSSTVCVTLQQVNSGDYNYNMNVLNNSVSGSGFTIFNSGVLSIYWSAIGYLG